MRGYIGNTDFDWYRFLHAQGGLDEVNFWQPSGGRGFRAIQVGEPFLFKLKAPHNSICGFGLFARHSVLPDWLAWEAFDTANGAESYPSMRARIEKYIPAERHGPQVQYPVGCIIVAEPVLFDEPEWIPQPRDWAPNIVSGKTYDVGEGEGRRIWDACLERAASKRPEFVAEGDQPRFGTPRLVEPRLGQGGFRIAVTDAYERACAVTTEHSLPVLEAAHIQPYAKGGLHQVRNGLCLRTDIHRLYDKGYVTITPDHRFEVSRRLREEWDNGRSYYELHGRKVRVPARADERPDSRLLAWHNEGVYRG